MAPRKQKMNEVVADGAEEAEAPLSPVEQLVEELRAAATGKAKKESVQYKEVGLERHRQGHIILPEGMDIPQAITWLQRMQKDLEQEVNVRYTFPAFPFDGARALYKAMKNLYGFVDTQPSRWMTATMIDIQVAFGVHEQVPWGAMRVPGLEGILQTGVDFEGEVPQFIVGGSVKKRQQPLVAALMEETRRILREESIYTGQAWRVDLSFMDGKTEFNLDKHQPKFIDLSKVEKDALILAEETERMLYIEVWDRLTNTAELEARGVKIKHGLLFAGDYGTGKTFAAMVTIKIAVENNWTAIYLDSPDQLEYALRFSKLFPQVVIFGEDIDRVVRGNTNSERTPAIDRIANMLDGLDTKADKVIVILTTNDQKAIHPVLKRAGRLDYAIRFKQPDGPTSWRLLQRVLGDNLKPGEDLSQLGDAFADLNAAYISEGAGKAQMIALRDTGQTYQSVTVHHLDLAAKLVHDHLELLSEDPDHEDVNLWEAFQQANVDLKQLRKTVTNEPDRGKKSKK